MIHKKKKELRKKVQELRDAIDLEQRKALSAHVAENLWSIPEFAAAKTVLFFISFRSEVDTVPMIRRALSEDKVVCVPCTNDGDKSMVASRILDLEADLEMGNYDILEPRKGCLRPVNAEEIDVVLMPGVAFDLTGGRLGYGGGYYDRFLERCNPRCALIAVAFEIQIVGHVPCADHDAHIHKVVTEARVIDCGDGCRPS
ncbi:MAG: 5-formyltetrahydrofolate cyclo-ligase [Actinomycetota bacterium]|nr:5-formyltetrahydrofolate cyclo-ligase [Actinomycetota bacterium]MDD5666293.1 5-formyltetrahydrofolate cyclo-ligase [Actinomycetota bacterium]